MVLLGKAASFEAAVIDLEKVWGGTALHEAAKRGFDGLVKLLLQEKAVDPDSKEDEDGRTPLSWAAERGARGRGEAATTGEGRRPGPQRWVWSDAAVVGRGERARGRVRLLLLEKGVNPSSKDDRYGLTPLSWAGANGHEAVVRLLEPKTRR
jgi:ankyrin repeat protein